MKTAEIPTVHEVLEKSPLVSVIPLSHENGSGRSL